MGTPQRIDGPDTPGARGAAPWGSGANRSQPGALAGGEQMKKWVEPKAIRDIMVPSPVAVRPDTSLLDLPPRSRRRREEPAMGSAGKVPVKGSPIASVGEP
jgi:hypothetical protein